MLKLIFFGSALLVLYIFIGYPLLLALWEKVRTTKSSGVSSSGFGGEFSSAAEDNYKPAISIVIAAHNEAHHVERRLSNLLAQDYDLSSVQIIVGSDGSTDDTVAVLESWRDRVAAAGAVLDVLAIPERGGKSQVLNTAIPMAAYEIIVLADMRQTFSADALSNLVRRFADPGVGAVSGELFLSDPDAKPGEQSGADMGAYWRYEKVIRKLEAKIHSTVGATGAIYAIRKSLFEPVPQETLIEDVVIPMQICMQGKRVLFADDAHAYDVAPSDGKREWLRKVRTLAGNWQLIKIRPQFMNPLANPVWLQFMSHKLLRLTLPFCLFLMFVTSYRIEGPTYTFAFTAQCLAYMLALACVFWEKLESMRIPGLAYFFCILNAAIVVGLFRLLSGKTSGLWTFAYKEEAGLESAQSAKVNS